MPPIDSSTAQVATWLSQHFITSFERDVDPALWTPVGAAAEERGFFALRPNGGARDAGALA
jgi:hypothetical protein